jgi:hypothetical protein
MIKKNSNTEIIVIMDSSGSMYHLKNDVIGGYNKLINEQNALPGEANFTLYLFNTITKCLYENSPLKDVRELRSSDYSPDGMTALLDTIGDVISGLETRYSLTPKKNLPGKVLLVIMTDGEENSSKKYTKSQIRSMIEHHQTNDKWTILFVGAGIDSFSEAGSIGISKSHTVNVSHDTRGMVQTYDCMSKNILSARYDPR